MPFVQASACRLEESLLQRSLPQVDGFEPGESNSRPRNALLTVSIRLSTGACDENDRDPVTMLIRTYKAAPMRQDQLDRHQETVTRMNNSTATDKAISRNSRRLGENQASHGEQNTWEKLRFVDLRALVVVPEDEEVGNRHQL